VSEAFTDGKRNALDPHERLCMRSTTEEDAFWQALLAHPDDLSLRLILADWFEERGDERGELLRLMHLLTQSVDVPGRATLESRLRALAAGAPQPCNAVTANCLAMKLALIPAGEFTMGSPESEGPLQWTELSPRRVQMARPFYLGVYAVTQEEYELVMDANPSEYSRGGFFKSRVTGLDVARWPVENVSWFDAIEFCNRLSELEDRYPMYPPERHDNHKTYRQWRAKAAALGADGYRLPTEAEWEYACRAGTTTATSFGNQLSSRQANFNGNDPYNGAERGAYLERPAEVGHYPPNAWGLYDMHGNVFEWCDDWLLQPPPREDDSWRNEDGAKQGGWNRVYRGGYFLGGGAPCRSAWRDWDLPTERSSLHGFRVAREIRLTS
jgi:uncharacterized protein (TIGR02996 family)